jgi:class 3 adenylate cyclase
VVLFTDLVGSTELRGRLGEEAADDLRRKHDQLLTQAVEANNGRVVKGLGDGIMATFTGASNAVAAAVAIQRALGNRDWPDDLEVRVRIGIHSGHPTLTDVGYIGLAVHTTARVCAAAHGGQIVVSANARAAVRTSLPAGIRFRGLGRHRLPGLPEIETLYQVRAKGLRATFPKPRIGKTARPPGAPGRPSKASKRARRPARRAR